MAKKQMAPEWFTPLSWPDRVRLTDVARYFDVVNSTPYNWVQRGDCPRNHDGTFSITEVEHWKNERDYHGC